MANYRNAAGGALTGAGIGTAIAPGIGTAIGAGAGGLISLFSGGDDSPDDVPDFAMPKTDPALQREMDAAQARASQSPSEIQARDMIGVDDAGKGLMGTMDQISSGGKDPNMDAALSRRMNDIYGSAQGDARTNTGLQAPMTQMSRLITAQSNWTNQQKILLQAYEHQYQAWLTKQNVRNGILKDLFSAGGMAAGMGIARMGRGTSTPGGPISQSQLDTSGLDTSSPAAFV